MHFIIYLNVKTRIGGYVYLLKISQKHFKLNLNLEFSVYIIHTAPSL